VLAGALARAADADLAAEVAGFYRGYADWLVDTAATLVVDEDAADLTPTVTQRLAGRAKDAVGVPFRVADHAVSRVAHLVS
jgi:hypothetical protein